MDVFNLFTTTDYELLQLESGAGGNAIVQEWTANGVVKLRDGMVQSDNMETFESGSTLHVRPTEAFIAVLGGNLVGNGVRVAKDNHTTTEYRIIGQTEGYDFDTGELAFYKVTLKRESVWETSDLPLT